MKRRGFLANGMTAGVGLSLFPRGRRPADPSPSPQAKSAAPAPLGSPVVISSGNGLRAVKRALEVLSGGGGLLDAIISGVAIVEDDPLDHSVGYGGLPNEDGVVQLDAAVMYGPTHASGGVAALEKIKNPAQVARLVMERSNHCLLVGEGALRFAKAHGFKEMDLLTDEARQIWLKWREDLSDRDNWLSLPPDKMSEEAKRFASVHGTIHCSAVDTRGNLAGVTTTSGLAFKLSGRVGDSPIVGAGVYVDNAAGAAGSTGRGEANLTNLSSFFIVERMRAGASPTDACLDACRRIVEHNRLPHLRNGRGLPNFNVSFYALSKSGQVGGATIYGGGKMSVGDSQGVRAVDMAKLYPQEWMQS